MAPVGVRAMTTVEVDRRKIDPANFVSLAARREYQNATHSYSACGLRFRWYRSPDDPGVFVVKEARGSAWALLCKGDVSTWPATEAKVLVLIHRVLRAEARREQRAS